MTITNKVSNKTLMPGITPIPDVVDAPTIGTATDSGDGTTASVPFTAAVTGGTATSFTAVSTPGSITGSSATSPISVTGLTAGTAYTFKTYGANSSGTWSAVQSSASNSLTLALPPSYDSIATTTVSGTSTNSIVFSSIPQTYTNLQLRYIAGSNGSYGDDTWTRLILNGTTTATNNYARHELYGYNLSAAGAASVNNSNDNLFFLLPGTTGSGWACGVTDIPDYTSTNKYKTLRTLTGWDNNASSPYGTNASGRINLTSHLYLANTNAITEVRIDMFGSDYFRPNTQFALYGIKG